MDLKPTCYDGYDQQKKLQSKNNSDYIHINF